MRIIAFINKGPLIREILGHQGEPSSVPRLAAVRGPLLWDLSVNGQTSGKLIRSPSRHRTTNSINALLGRDEYDKC